MIRIFRGDDVAFSKFDRRVCVYINTFDDLTGWTASFELFDNVKSFSDISSGCFSFGYSAEETQSFPLGQTYAKLTLMDATGKVRVCKKVEVEVQNKIAMQDCGSIAVSTDVVLSDFSQMGNIPTINGKKLNGDHDGSYYGLASQEQMDANANLIATQQLAVAEIREQGLRTATAVADQGVAIATNAQNIEGNRTEIRTLATAFNAYADERNGRLAVLTRKLEGEKEDRIEAVEGAKTYAKELALSAEQKALDAKRTAEDLDSSLKAQIATVSRDVANEASQRRAENQSLREEFSTAKTVMENGIAANEQKIDGINSTLTASVTRLSDKVSALRSETADKLANEASLRSEDVARVQANVDALRLKSEGELDTAKKNLGDRISNIEAKSDEIDRRMGTSLAAEIKSREFTDAALTAELGTRLASDKELSNRIVAEKNLREAGDADTLAAAKAYTDQKTTAAIVYRGSVNTVLDLDNIVEKAVGDMYNVKENGANYVWSGGSGADYHGWDKQSETVNLAPFIEKDAEHDARLDAVEAKADANESAIATETAERKAAVTGEREYADALNAATVEAFSQSLSAVQSDYAATNRSLSEEVTARTNVDANLDTKISAEQTARGAEVSRLDSEIASLRAALDAETGSRTDGDESTRQNITNQINAAKESVLAAVAVERTARENADRTLAADIANETELRERAVAVERTARENAIDAGITTMNTAVSGEATARADADAVLDSRISTEITNRQTAVEDEAALRKQNDDILYGKIETEREQSVARDTALTQNLAHETDVRTSEDARLDNESRARDTALQNAISQEALDRASSDADMLQAAKEYADSVGVKAMHYKGTVTDRNALEAIAEKATGDIYNVLTYQTDEKDEDDQYIVVQGANFAWNGAAWDKLSETIDLSPLEKADEALDARVTTCESDITAHDGRISQIENTDIPAIEADIATNAGNITANANAITALQGRATTLEQTVNGTAGSSTDGLVRRLGAAETTLTATKNWLGNVQTGKNDITSRVTALEDSVDAASSGLKAKVAALETRAGNIESAATTLTNRVASDETDLQNLSDAFDTEKASTVQRFNAASTARSEIVTALQNEVTRATGAETTLGGRIDSLSTTVTTGLAGANTAVANERTAREAAVSAEATSRSDADAAEATARSAADTAISNRVTSLETTVGASDTAANSVRQRVKTLETNYTTVSSNLTAEQTARANADTALSNRVTTLETTVGASDSAANSVRQRVKTLETNYASVTSDVSTNATAIATEKTRAQGVEATLSQSISNENSRAVARENAIADDLTAENSRAVARENAIETAAAKKSEVNPEITALKNRCTALETKVATLEALLKSVFGNALPQNPTSVTLLRTGDSAPCTITIIEDTNPDTGLPETMLQVTENS